MPQTNLSELRKDTPERKRAIAACPLLEMIRSYHREPGKEKPRPDAVLGAIIGKSPPVFALKTYIMVAAETGRTVLITGESGTGKELAARATFLLSERYNRPFVSVNCSAIPPSLAESELFGHTRGAFTGADREKEGLFEQADGGTLFLDEMGELPLDIQAKLLRVLEDGEVRRIGGIRPTQVDVVVIAATNADVEAEVKKKKFREDLFYRLQQARIRTPSLKERSADVTLLVKHALIQFNYENGCSVPVEPDALDLISRFNFPGNIRQLTNLVHFAAYLAKHLGRPIDPDIVTQAVCQLGGGIEPIGEISMDLSEASTRLKPFFTESNMDIEFARKAAELAVIKVALERTDWSASRAAALLGMDRSYLYKKAKELGLDLAGEKKKHES